MAVCLTHTGGLLQLWFCCVILPGERSLHDSPHTQNIHGNIPGLHVCYVLQGRVTVGHLAARNGHVQVLGVLASHGFDLNSDTLDMTSPLHDAAHHGQVAAVAWLLRAGVNPSVKNFNGKTAQDLARAEQHHAVVQQLQQAAVAAANNINGSAGGSGQSTPTAAVADGARQGAAGQQQQQQHWQVYPENEQYKNYPTFNRVGG